MTQTVVRRRIEVLVDAPLVRTIVAASKQAGITAYTLLPTLGGDGALGAWSDDQLSGAQSKQVFLAITSQDKTDAFVALLEPILESHGLVLLIGSTEVIRASKF